jgi:hypothetical protein
MNGSCLQQTFMLRSNGWHRLLEILRALSAIGQPCGFPLVTRKRDLPATLFDNRSFG